MHVSANTKVIVKFQNRCFNSTKLYSRATYPKLLNTFHSISAQWPRFSFKCDFDFVRHDHRVALRFCIVKVLCFYLSFSNSRLCIVKCRKYSPSAKNPTKMVNQMGDQVVVTCFPKNLFLSITEIDAHKFFSFFFVIELGRNSAQWRWHLSEFNGRNFICYSFLLVK